MDFGPQQILISGHNVPRASAMRLVAADTNIGFIDVMW